MLAVALLATILGGCKLLSDGPAVSGLPRHVPRDCKRLFVKVPDPGAKEGDDLGDIAARYKGAFHKANGRIVRGGDCAEHQADAIERGAK